jgi:DNA-binding NarL/FixJ family response regulator
MENHQSKIALVDDHALLRKAVNYRLTGMGYQVVMEAENGQQFLDKLEKKESPSPDLCLLDINMPVLNGFETAAQLKKKWPAIKIIFFSMNDGNGFKNKAKELGADGYICKDASSEEFIKVLYTLLPPAV